MSKSNNYFMGILFGILILLFCLYRLKNREYFDNPPKDPIITWIDNASDTVIQVISVLKTLPGNKLDQFMGMVDLSSPDMNITIAHQLLNYLLVLHNTKNDIVTAINNIDTNKYNEIKSNLRKVIKPVIDGVNENIKV